MAENEIQPTEAATPATNDPGTIMQVISRAASDPQTDVDKLERLMGMYERLEERKAEGEFARAMNVAQSEIRRVAADANNSQTRSKYATYAKLDSALRPVYAKHGFSLSFDTGEAPAELVVRVVCYVMHESGHTRTYHVDMPADGKGAKGGDVMTKTHATGSAMSYGMRYLLKMIFNVAVGEEDDDGNGAASPIISEQRAKKIESRIKALVKSGKIQDRAKFDNWMRTQLKVTRVDDLTEDAADTVEAALTKREGE